MRYLILGKKGQLGQGFERELKDKDILALDYEECDISDFDKLKEVFESYKPDIVLNCTAYNLVDKAETDFFNAYKTNAYGVKNLAYLSKKHKAYFITYSTDYVFDGTKEGLYKEEDTPNPLNQYGKSKLTGEVWTLEEGLEKFLIFRTSWVYGDGKQNFLYKLLEWAKNQDYLRIACDEFSVPTSTRTLVNITLKAIKQGLIGLYHLTNSGYASRYEWAKEFLAFKKIDKFVYPAYQSDFNLPAKRPRFSPMDNTKISKALNLEIPHWLEEMKDFLK
ncbi:dTDP-4-dehydrorhamnose reductase [Hydrogenobaculum acidophilum]